MKMNIMDYIAWVLIIIGGLNWGLVGAFKYNLVDGIFGVDSVLSRIVYIVVGLAAVYAAVVLVMRLGKNKTTA